MSSMKVKYLGQLRTESLHVPSGQKIITDAPKDNQGKGEAFSPTDICASSLASCMMTIMGIFCQRENINMDGMEAQVEKIMNTTPRKIAEIKIIFTWNEAKRYGEDQIIKIKRAALSCPVTLSLGAEVKQSIKFEF